MYTDGYTLFTEPLFKGAIAVIGNDLKVRSSYSSSPFKLRPDEGGGTSTQVGETALAWVRGQAPVQAHHQKGGGSVAPLNAPPRPPPSPITASTPTAGVVGSMKTALGNLERELGCLRPHQTEKFLILLGDPKATVPPDLAGAHRALTQALETFNAASGRPDFDQVHRLLGEVKPPYTLSNDLLGLGLGSAQAYEAATEARSLLVTERDRNPALKEIRYMDIKEDTGVPSVLHIQHTSSDEASLRAAVTQVLEKNGSKAEVSFQRMGEAKPTLSPQQYLLAMDHTAKARNAIMEGRVGNAPLDDIAYMHLKEDGGKRPTLLVEHFAGDEQALKREVDAVLRRGGLEDVDVQLRRLGPKPPLTETQYIAALETAQNARALIMEKRSGNKALDSITYMHIKEGPGTDKPPTLRIENDGKDGGALKVEVLDLLRRNGLLGDVEFGLTGGR